MVEIIVGALAAITAIVAALISRLPVDKAVKLGAASLGAILIAVGVALIVVGVRSREHAGPAASGQSSSPSESVLSSGAPAPSSFAGKYKIDQVVAPNGQCLHLHTHPTASETPIGCIPNGTIVHIQCTVVPTNGATQYGFAGASRIWDRVSYGGKTGFVTDADVYTGKSTAAAAACS